MKTLFILTALLAIFGLTIQQREKSKEELIGELLNLTIPSNPNTNCVCVNYYLCKNDYTIITDGSGLIDIRSGGNQRECPNRYQFCCAPPNIVDKPIMPESNPVQGECGYRHENGVAFRKTGEDNNEAKFGEFPWMVAVLHEERGKNSGGEDITVKVYKCGGTLIHPKVVITAAHCMNYTGTYIIRAGEWDSRTTDAMFPHQERKVKSWTIHPEYYAGALFNDIAVLILNEPFKIKEHVNVACLPNQWEVIPEGTRCFVTGWGRDTFGKEGKYQVILKKIELPIIERNTCQKYLRRTRLGAYFNLHHSFICAGSELGKDACKGDGGSPLVCPIPGSKGRYQQVGMVAWGIGCGGYNVPGLYVNVPLFRNWIDGEMRKHGLDTSGYTY